MTKKISDFKTQSKNANRHTPYGLRLLEKSLREDGYIDGMTAAADGEIISLFYAFLCDMTRIVLSRSRHRICTLETLPTL